MRALRLVLPLLLAACGGTDTTIGKTTVDADSDGYASDVDCDDAHASVNPDAPERCDGIDDDCDGVVDEDATDAVAWYADADGDTYGDPSALTLACEAPPGTVADATDCDDAQAAAFPGNPEVCDGLDNDCDGAVDDEDDDDATDVATWYQDADDDQYGDAAVAAAACEAPPGFVADATDCDDDRVDVHPGAPEDDCTDPTDYNCDGSVLWADADGDGHAACEDCDDLDETRNPGAQETCDDADVDEDCDGAADDADPSAVGQTTWYRDADEDGYAPGTGAPLVQCEPSVGYADALGDCDDYAGEVNPGGTEVCDPYGTDEDCDGLVDDDDPSTDSATWTAWYADRDGDTYGDPSRTARQCTAPTGYVGNDDDCDDAEAARNPGEAEVCDAATLDEDCDGLADDADPDVLGGATWYADADADGYGGTTTASACAAPTGYVGTGGDCDDAAAAVNPAAAEVCDPADVDEDCDGAADDADTSAAGEGTWYRDADADGYGGATTASACAAPTGYVGTGGDCDDAARGVNPAAAEVCDAADVDEDCDGAADDADPDARGGSTWYPDADADGYGAASPAATACDAPAGHGADASDCDDADPAAFPGGSETCGDGVDQDCDGADLTCAGPRLSGDYAVDSGYMTKIYGTSADDQFGISLVAGDFDGDGRGDVVVGATNGDGSTSYPDHGVAYGYYGPLPTGVSSALDHDSFGVYNTTSGSAGYFSRYLSNLGDIDGDGREDVLVSRLNGAGYVYLGGDSSMYAASAYDVPVSCSAGATAGDESDPSGQDEWLCGNYAMSTYAGIVDVFSGSGPSTLATLTGENARDYAGWSVAGGTDVDGDGFDDMVVGADGNDAGGDRAGAVYVVYAPVTGYFSLAYADAKFVGAAADDCFGDIVVSPGDWDGDGYGDVAGGADYAEASSGTNTGVIYVFTDFPAGVSAAASSADLVLAGEDPSDLIGTAFAAGDVDADGSPDLVVGTTTNDDNGSLAGGVWLVYGPASGTTSLSAADAAWLGTSVSDGLGISVAVVPDTDGDGKDEVAMGAYQGDERGYVDHGAVYVFAGQ